MTSRRQQLSTSVREASSRLDEIERHLDIMQTILMVREPSSSIAAEAYDGLRKQVVASMTARVAHLSQLALMSEAVNSGADGATLRELVESWVESAGLLRITDVADPASTHAFDVVQDLGGEWECLAPAYVDTQTGRVMRTGKARRIALTPREPAATPDPIPEPDLTTNGETES